jgi:tellurite resistance protein TehA-like permease
MATGIVSVAAADHGYRCLSDILLVLAAALLPTLTIGVAITWRRHHWRLRDLEVAVPLFTFVAANAVLATRLSGHRGAAWALTVVALSVWLVLVPVTARQMWCERGTRLRDRARGGWELTSVATSGTAIVLAEHRMATAALIVWVLAIVFYVVMTTLILLRVADEAASPVLVSPDAWILMGALAIATLAGIHVHGDVDDRLAAGIRWVTVVTWIAATLWIPILTWMALRHLKELRAVPPGVVWFAMVFPLGMYAATTYALADETGWMSLRTVSWLFCGIAVLSWLGVAIAALLAGATHARRADPRRP